MMSDTMHIAIGYSWSPAAVGYHLERALLALGHKVTYVGLPYDQRQGYDSSVSINDMIATMPETPDLYFWVDPTGRYFPLGIGDLSIPSACYLIDVHLGTWRQQVARFFDSVFIAQKDYLDTFRDAVGHAQVYWLPLAAASDVHRRHDSPRTYDVGFVGNIAFAHRRTPRARRLRAIAKRCHTNDFYRAYSPQEVGQVYSQSKIVFNTSIAGDVTMRVFEGTACGALMLTDSVANGLEHLFDIGHEIVTFDDDADLLGKVAYYLEHEDERERIAQAGYERTHAQHTYLHRMEQMIDTTSASSFRRLAPMRRADNEERWAARYEVYTHLHMLDAILDGARSQEHKPLRRAWVALPCLIRRLLF